MHDPNPTAWALKFLVALVVFIGIVLLVEWVIHRVWRKL